MEGSYLPGNIRQRMQELMKEHKITQAQLATRIGSTESAISRFVSGKTDKISTEHLLRISKVFEVCTDFLRGEVNTPDRTKFDIEELGLSVQAARNLYTGKAKTLCALLAKALPDHPVRVGENGLQVQIETPMLPDSAPFEQAGLALYIVKEKSGKNIVVVSPSAVPADRLEEAAHAVAAALYKAEEAAKAKRSKDIY